MSNCAMKVYPGDVLHYNNPKSDRNGTIYLVAVRCGGKDNPKESCTHPVLIDVATGYSRKGTTSRPTNMPRGDWREVGVPLVDLVGSKAPMFSKTELMVGTAIRQTAPR